MLLHVLISVSNDTAHPATSLADELSLNFTASLKHLCCEFSLAPYLYLIVPFSLLRKLFYVPGLLHWLCAALVFYSPYILLLPWEQINSAAPKPAALILPAGQNHDLVMAAPPA